MNFEVIILVTSGIITNMLLMIQLNYKDAKFDIGIHKPEIRVM